MDLLKNFFRNALLENKSLWKLVISLEASFINVVAFIYSIMEREITSIPVYIFCFILCCILLTQ